jgi:hypothetical protein
MAGRIFDDDTTSPTNFNRNMLTLAGDADSEKVQLVADRSAPEFHLTPKYQRFLAASPGARQIAPYVLVGVDDIASRWQVQRCASGLLVVSGTSHFSISSSCHGPGEPCCGCLHPVDDLGGPTAIPTVSFISFWAGLAMAVRLVRKAIGTGYALDRQHLGTGVSEHSIMLRCTFPWLLKKTQLELCTLCSNDYRLDSKISIHNSKVLSCQSVFPMTLCRSSVLYRSRRNSASSF